MSLLEKFIHGAATGGSAALMVKYKQDLERQRDEMLEKYRAAAQERSQQFTAGENQMNRAHESGERAADRDFRAEESDADRAHQEGIVGRQIASADARSEREIGSRERMSQAEIDAMQGVRDATARKTGAEADITEQVATGERPEKDPEYVQEYTTTQDEATGRAIKVPTGWWVNKFDPNDRKPMAGAAGAGGEMPDMPDPAKHTGKTIVDNETGKRYRSDGSRWNPL